MRYMICLRDGEREGMLAVLAPELARRQRAEIDSQKEKGVYDAIGGQYRADFAGARAVVAEVPLSGGKVVVGRLVGGREADVTVRMDMVPAGGAWLIESLGYAHQLKAPAPAAAGE